MPQVRLGRMTLHWCQGCGVPLLDGRPCAACGEGPAPVQLTPPGDARPAFGFDIEMVRELARAQFGPRAGERLLADGELVLLNRIPDLDRTDEVIAGGEVVANLTFLLGRGFALQLRMAGARRLGVPERGWVVADPGAVPSILESSNLLGPGVADRAGGILPGDEVVVLEEHEGARAVLAAGSARMSSADMGALKKGTAVKVRWRREPGAPGAPPALARAASWREAVEANRTALEEAVRASVKFIREGAARVGRPVAVSYSGGKDSLATLLLVLESGLRPKVLFLDTGLEFPETRKNAEDTCRVLGLELLTESAGEAFWENLPRFGPPARDARWCCKCCKLGPAARLIAREFPRGVLSFIGQRRYESASRASKGPVWRNPWVPGQVGASPIQDWPALRVWLYLFSKGAAVNPWYERGLDRIGCFLCPATNLGDLELVSRAFPGYLRWEKHLGELPPAWREIGLWRWRRLPPGILEHLGQRGIPHSSPPAFPPRLLLELQAARAIEDRGGGEEGTGVELQGRFSRPLDLQALGSRLRVLGKTLLGADGLEVGGWGELRSDGSVRARARDEMRARERMTRLEEAVRRSEECAGCGICTGRCPAGAASVREGRMVIDGERCTSCGACLAGPCPVTTYAPETQEDG